MKIENKLFKGIIRAVSLCKSRMSVAGAILLGFATIASADIYVNAVASQEGADGSEAHPYVTIQDAVNNASNGDTIRVAEGVYSTGALPVAEGSACHSVVTIIGKRLHLIGAGRGKSVIVGSRDPNAGNAYSDTLAEHAARCVFVKESEGTIIEGFTLRNGETLQEKSSPDIYNAGAGLYADSTAVFLVDCEISHCAGKYGSPMYKGTAVRCLLDGNFGTSGPGGRGCRLVNSVVTRSVAAGTSTGAMYDSELYNCTLIDNKATWAMQKETDKAYNTVIVFSSNEIVYRETNLVSAVVENCVLASTAPNGTVQLVGPAVGDWRLLSSSDAIKAGALSHIQSLSQSFPENINLFKDYLGRDIVADDEGRINAGAIQETVTPAAGALWFNKQISVNGHVSCNSRAATYVYPEVFPTQYCVRAVLNAGEYMYRLLRYNPYTGKQNGAYPSIVPQSDGRMWLMPPVDVAMTITNQVQLATDILWVDADNGKDDWGEGVEDLGSPLHPYATIQAAVDKVESIATSSKYSVINVLPGVYSNGITTLESAGRFRLCVNNNVNVRIYGVEGPEKTVICGSPEPDTKDSAENTAGLGPNAVACAYLKGCNVYLQGFTLSDGFSDSSDTSYSKGARGSAVYSVNGETSSANVMDCVITNCHSHSSIILNALVSRSHIVDCCSMSSYVMEGGLLWGSCFRGCASLNERAGVIGVVDADTFNSTFIGEPNVGRLCGSDRISYNCIWDGGENVYSSCVFTNSIAWNVKKYNSNASDYHAVDPLFASRETDGTLCVDSPAVGMGCTQWAGDYGDRFWRFGGGDINGDSIVFTHGRPTIGAFQKTINVVKVSALTPPNGGWHLEDADFGEFSFDETTAPLKIVPAAGSRPCVGITCDGVDYFFTNSPNETIVLDYQNFVNRGANVLEGIYSTDWYVDDDGDDGNTGFLPTHPKKTLADAAAMLSSGDTLWVFPGAYSEGGVRESDSQFLTNRVVVNEGTAVISTDGPESTFIIGAKATFEPDGYGCGTNAIRCAFVKKNARLSGFTLTGGHVNRNGKDDDKAGSAVAGSGRSINCVVDNCIISNNYSSMGTIYKADVFDSLIVRNVSSGQGVGVRQGNAYNCCFSENTGNSVLSYSQYVIGCTVLDNNFRENGNSSTLLANIVNGGRIFNSVFMGDVNYSTSSGDYAVISNCVCGKQSQYNERNTTGCVYEVDFSSELFMGEAIPVAGANAAVDAADESLCTNLYSQTDLRGFQRVMNGRRDIGAYEADWRSVYATTLCSSPNALVVESATPDVVKDGSVLKVKCGSLKAVWSNTTGKNVLCEIPVQVTGTGLLTVKLDDEVLGTVDASDGVVNLSFVNKIEYQRLDFSYSPGEMDGGCAVIGGFTRNRLAGFVFTVR